MSEGVSIADQVFRVRQKALIPSKKYRDVVKYWGEPDPTKLRRKRVVVASDLSTAPERDVEYIGVHKPDFRDGSQKDLDSLLQQRSAYKSWLDERMAMRKGLDNLGLSESWLKRKQNKTSLESRVLDQMEEKKKLKELTPSATSAQKSRDSSSTLSRGRKGQIPVIRQPSPAAIKIIDDHLRKHRLRLLDLFKQADKDKNWEVSAEEFRQIMTNTGVPLTEPQIESLILALDKDGNDNLDYRELVYGRTVWKKSMERYVLTSPTIETLQKRLIANPSRPRTSSSERSITPQIFVPDKPVRRVSSAGTLGQTPVRTPDTDHTLTSSPDFLTVPAVSISELVKTPEEERTLKVVKKFSRKDKRKKKAKPVIPKALYPSTMQGEIGQSIDKYKQEKYQEYQKAIELCQAHGVVLSTQLLERVLLAPGDKSVSYCRSHLNKDGQMTLPMPAALRRSLISQDQRDAKRAKSPRAPKKSPRSKPFELGKSEVSGKLKKLLARKESMGDIMHAIELSGTSPADIFPPANQVKFIPEKMVLSTGPAEIVSKTDCWMTFEEYEKLTSSLDSKFKRLQLNTDENAFWPQSLLDKLRICLDDNPVKVNTKCYFEVVEKPRVLPRQSYF